MTENKNQLDNHENTKKFDYKIITYDPNSPLFCLICRWFNANIGDSERYLDAIGELSLIIEKWLYTEGYDEFFGKECSDDDE